MDQWFVKMKPLAEKALSAIDKKEIEFVPERYEKVFRYWMENTIDWNISRQIVWGIPIPAWFHEPKCIPKPDREEDVKKCKKIVVSTEGRPKCEFCDAKYIQDTDTFDTWFSSGQWPLLTLGYPDGKDFKTFYPTEVMETGHDLIFKWIPRMVIFGLYLDSRVPFKKVYLHGLVNDAKGKKMSKSKGNVINPHDLTQKYGTDALRMALVVGNTPGTDMSLSEDKVKGYKHFANKIWNVSRFVMENTKDFNLSDKEKIKLDDYSEKKLTRLKEHSKEITEDLEKYRFYLAAEKLYHYFWHEFADIIVEESKERFKNPEESESTQYLLKIILETELKMLHPFMPFITEEIWSLFSVKDLLMIEEWPQK
jgi:valyl-tRNA synthetase